MAIEWISRVNRPFTLQDALDLTDVRLAGLLGQPGLRGSVEAREATAARRRGEPSDPVPKSILRQTIDPYRVAPPPPGEYLTVVAEMIFEVIEHSASTLVSVCQSEPRSGGSGYGIVRLGDGRADSDLAGDGHRRHACASRVRWRRGDRRVRLPVR
ncbi:hypothetical protein QTQ03_17935 [Micromonospora sp. WMMA1363]|uniref:hypothetical protein n=1 Tax=Micromonospora sp. WMMA1363 TaxID=3053985 RepID=UPI00259CDCD6|nr:hypothetical protein [Micromonospora sp. WMMA1363]MDM4721390.1 hypothetical protein [Micromonospora sp. WMMA1363]